jgi:hypothetical protein
VREQGETSIAFGPVGLAGCALRLLGILKRSRFVARLGFAGGVAGGVADVTVAELGGFKATNETRPSAPGGIAAMPGYPPGVMITL